MKVFRSSWISGEPHTCAGSLTSVLPAAISAAASSRWMLRSVASDLAVLETEVEETLAGERQTDIAADCVGGAVPGVVTAVARLDARAVVGVVEDEVDHAGDGVGAVLRGGAIAQDFHLLQRTRRDRRNVRSLRAVGDAIAEPVDDGSAMPALAVHEDQRVIGRKAAQVRRPDDRRGVADGLRVDVVRRHHVPEQVAQVGIALIGKFSRRQHIDRHG